MKRIAFVVACLLVALPSVPSFAIDSTLSGFFRSRFIMADLQKDTDKNPDKLVDQRVRLRWAMNVDDNIKFVYYGEIDMQYGDAAYANSRNQGGGASGDSVNLETKNVFVEAKLPGTPLTATVGLQPYVDHNSLSLLLGDMAGVKLASAFGDVSGNVAWFKLFEGDGNANHTIGLADSEDDITLWGAQLKYQSSKEWWARLDGYYVNAQDGTSYQPVLNIEGSGEDLYYISLSGVYEFPAAKLNAWVYYNGGTSDEAGVDGAGTPTGKDVDTSAIAAAVTGSFNVAGAETSIRGIFFSGDDDATDTDRSAVRIPWADNNTPVGMSVPFPASGLMIFLADNEATTYHSGYGFAINDAAFAEYGLVALTADATYIPPSNENLWFRGAVGYFRSTEDDHKVAGSKREGKTLGSEVCGRVGYKFGRFEVSLNGAHAWLGDFYDKTATNGKDPDNPYEVYAMVNVKL